MGCWVLRRCDYWEQMWIYPVDIAFHLKYMSLSCTCGSLKELWGHGCSLVFNPSPSRPNRRLSRAHFCKHSCLAGASVFNSMIP